MKELYVTDLLEQCLMFHCLNWGEPDCLSGAKGFAERSEIKTPEAASRGFLSATEMTRLNELCSHCKAAFLRIQKRECPICGSDQVETILEKDSIPSPILFVYKCETCGRLLFSDAELKE
jgi:DNA-directed RNA polymerase subunit RPC12/RpoP